MKLLPRIHILALVAGGGLGLQVAATAESIISVNISFNASGNTAIDPGDVFGVASEETVVGNWNNMTAWGAANALASLIRADGTASGVAAVGRNGGGQQYWGADYVNTPWNYGLSHFVGTTGAVSLEFSKLGQEFPHGYYAIVYIGGVALNLGAAVTDGTTVYYFQTPNPADPTPMQVTDTVDDGVYQTGNYVVFGSVEFPLTSDSIVFSIPTGSVASNNAGIGGVQLVGLPEPEYRHFYLDASTGDDSYDGATPETAWQSMGRLETESFGPGDRILFRRGEVFRGRFTLNGSGTPNLPLMIGAYGDGPKPHLAGGSLDLEVILIGDNSGLEISDLRISNNRPFGAHPNCYGIRIKTTDGAGELPHLVFRNLDLVDIIGSGTNHESRGILARTGEDDTADPTRWNGFLIEDCHFENIDGRAVQLIDTSHSLADHRIRGTSYFPTIGFVFQNNTGLNIHRNLLMIRGTRGAIIQHNYMSGTVRGSAFWPFDAEGTLVQFNDFRHLRNPDADAYVCHFDYNCIDSVMQYNFGYDVEGGLIEIIVLSQFPTFFQENAVARYNVGVDVGFRGNVNSAGIFYTGRVTGSKVYNNTLIFTDLHPSYRGLAVNNWGGEWPDNNVTHNNLFYAAGSPVTHLATERLGQLGNVLSHNLYHGNVSAPDTDGAPITGDPKLMNPLGLDPQDFRVAFGSSAIGAGLIMSGNGGRDYLGNSVSSDLPPTIGFHEYQSDPWIDSNGDGLPDEWKARYGLVVDGVVDLSADLDGDSFSMYEEFVADSDPLDPGSFFSVQVEARSTPGEILLDWTARPARLYRLWQSTDLVDWELRTSEPVDPPYGIAEGNDRMFFRVEAFLPERYPGRK